LKSADEGLRVKVPPRWEVAALRYSTLRNRQVGL
jgi:hypothetical protein